MTTAYTTPLTIEECATINAAVDILLAHTAPNASWSIKGNHWHGSCDFGGFTYFTSNRTQHTFCEGKAPSDQVQWALAQEASEYVNSDKVRADKIERLKAELAELGEPA